MIGPVESVRCYTFLLERFDNSHPADILNNLICHLIDTFLPDRGIFTALALDKLQPGCRNCHSQ